MKVGGGLRLFIALSLAFALFLAGCLQSKHSDKCAGIADLGQKDACIEYVAVWYQDPYMCYEINAPKIKESCFERAVEPQEAKILQAQWGYEQQIETVVEQKKAAQTETLAQDKDIDPQLKRCMADEGFGLDGCLHKIAIERLDISMCEKIGSESYRRPCISNIAITGKDPSVCGRLARTDDRQLCKFYATPG